MEVFSSIQNNTSLQNTILPFTSKYNVENVIGQVYVASGVYRYQLLVLNNFLSIVLEIEYCIEV